MKIDSLPITAEDALGMPGVSEAVPARGMKPRAGGVAIGPRPLTAARFRPFGRIIEYPHKEKKGSQRNLWRIVHAEKSKVGWRIAYLVLRDKTIGRLECHPFSDETFEPVKGRALLFVSRNQDVTSVRCFLLDRPVIVKKGIWHGLVTLSAETEIKIAENASVACRYWPLGRRLRDLKDIAPIRHKRD